MKATRFLSEAERDLAEAYDWYEQQNRGLGKVFTATVRETLVHVHFDPWSHPAVRGETRRHPVSRFPFDVLFVVDEDDDDVVIAVMHHRRHPKSWWHRRPT